MDDIRECIENSKSALDTALSALVDDATYTQRQAVIQQLHEAWGCTNQAIAALYALDDSEDSE